jgi:hypothetical protein
VSFPPRISERLRRAASFGRARALCAVAALLVAGRGSEAPCATVVIGADGAPVIAAGRVQIYPSFIAVIEHNNNLFYVDADQTATWMRVVSPGVSVELPFSHSLVRFGYNLSLRKYSLVDSRWIDTHTALFDLDLAFGNGAAVAVHDDFHLGILDNPVGAPGTELPFQQNYRANTAEVSVGHERAGHHLMGLRLRSLSTTYLPPIVAGYFNEDAWSIAAFGNWHVGPRTWLVWEAQGGTANLDRPESTAATADQRVEDELSALVGAGWELSTHAMVQFYIGPTRVAYNATAPSTFTGVVGRLVAQNATATGTQWFVGFYRDVYPSTLENNNYFVSNLLTAQAEMPRGTSLRFGGSAAYYRNDYPTDPQHQLDQIVGVQTWMGIQQGVWVEWRVYVRYDQRFSSVPGADYSTVRFGAGLVVGR